MRAAPPEFVAGTAIPVLPLFVYGTLLPGQPLAYVVAPHVVECAPASAAGRLYWHASGDFPVLVPGDDGNDDDLDDGSGEARAQGLRVVVRPDAGLLQFLAVDEITYGYDARWLPLRDPSGGSLGSALAFCWTWGASTLGSAIGSGLFADRRSMEAGYS